MFSCMTYQMFRMTFNPLYTNGFFLQVWYKKKLRVGVSDYDFYKKYCIFCLKIFFLAHLSHWLMVSYCNHWMCVVVRRQQLLQMISPPKLLADFDKTWQECSLYGPLPKLFKWFWSIAYPEMPTIPIFCGILPFFKADFRITTLDIKIPQNNDFTSKNGTR